MKEKGSFTSPTTFAHTSCLIIATLNGGYFSFIKVYNTILLLLLCTVDVLNAVGLRDGNPEEDGASLAFGPSGSLDAFALTQELTAPTTEREWELIGADFDTQFGVYTTFDAVGYTGSIISISDGVLLEFVLSLNSSIEEINKTQTLSITLPNFSFDFDVEIPSQGDGGFQSIGIALEEGRLIVVVNCTVIDIIPVEFAVGSLPSEGANVAIFSEPTTVSCAVNR